MRADGLQEEQSGRSGQARQALLCGSILLGWGLVVAVTMARHEFWRDEIRALSLAMDANSLPDLKALLENEGHPMLWYVLLYAAYGLTGSKLVLPALSALVCGAAVLIFVWHAPFPIWFRALFVFGGLPLYEYSVMARNYGISMLLLFVFAGLYASRNERPILLVAVLALLANTNIHSAVLSCLLMGVWLWDVLVRERAPPFGKRALVAYGAGALLCAGLAFALWTVWPTSEMLASDTSRYTSANVIAAVVTTLGDPGHAFPHIAPREPGLLMLLSNVLLAGSMLGLLVDPPALAAAFCGLLGLSVLFQVVYKGGYRHEGLFVIFLIALHWIAHERGQRPLRSSLARRLVRFGSYVALPGILAILVATGGYNIFVDLTQQESASKAFGTLLPAHREYADAILIGEPDFYLESLRYYADNPVYIVRERRFGHTVRFLRNSQHRLSMRQLLDSARGVQESSGKRVLIALGHMEQLDPAAPSDGKPHACEYPFTRTFEWSPEELAQWNASTKLVRTFSQNIHGDERYRVYELVARP